MNSSSNPSKALIQSQAKSLVLLPYGAWSRGGKRKQKTAVHSEVWRVTVGSRVCSDERSDARSETDKTPVLAPPVRVREFYLRGENPMSSLYHEKVRS